MRQDSTDKTSEGQICTKPVTHKAMHYNSLYTNWTTRMGQVNTDKKRLYEGDWT